jgi:hypothetical protein
MHQKICIVSGHYPDGVVYAKMTRLILEQYCKLHHYDFFYDAETPVAMITSELHFRRCLLLTKASEVFRECDWFLWLDTDIYVQDMHKRIEECIDLSDSKVYYHVFHEKPWLYPVNTGVKFIHKSVIHWEKELYAKRQGCPYPYEQKLVIDFILPTYGNKVKIHDPEKLNCLYKVHDATSALFVHVCSYQQFERNLIILKNTRGNYAGFPELTAHNYFRYWYLYYALYFIAKVKESVKRRAIKFIGSRYKS